jgi:hypothetical protein
MATLAVVVLNYRRPQNIGRIAAGAREALPDAPIFVLDNSEDPHFRERDDVPWGEVWLQTPPRNLGAAARLVLTSQLPFDHYLAIDDDLFLTLGQAKALARAVEQEPDRVHGLAGQRLEQRDGSIRAGTMMTQVQGQVSILNMVYAFSRPQAVVAAGRIEQMGFTDLREASVLDDILLSSSSPKPPMCHDLGPLSRCPTCDADGIAQWRGATFSPGRKAVISKLLALNALAVFEPTRFVSPS